MIVVLVLVLGAVGLGVLALLRDKIMQTNDYQFTVTAEGKVTAPPDIATVNFNVQSTISKNIGDIVKDGNTKMNAIIDALTKLKIDKADIQTSQYQLSPVYNYPVVTSKTPRVLMYNDGSSAVSSSGVSDGGTITTTQTVLQGYQLTEGVTIKIRDLTVVGDAIQAAIAAGANQAGDVSFTIDDQNKLKSEARADAIAKAVQNAQEIAKESGLKLGKLINVSDSSNPMPIYSYANGATMMAKTADALAAPAPSIQSGSLDVTDDVVLTYKVK